MCLLEITGFRGIANARIRLRPHSVLLGENDVGKTAVIDALALLLGRRQLVRDLWEHDFFGSTPSPVTRMSLRATITGLERDRLSEHPEWFAGEGASPVWWSDVAGTFAAEDGEVHSELAFQVGFSARFDHELAEVETVRYFVDGEQDPFEDSSIRTVKARHLQLLGFFLLPSGRTWDRVMSFSSDLFRRVLQVEEAIPGESLVRLRDWLRSPSERLETHDALQPIVERVERELAAYAGSGTKLSFKPTTGDTDGLLRALTPHLTGRASEPVPIGKHGSGVVSLQTLMLLLEIGRMRCAQQKSFILAAEEPELHLHPGHHRRVVAKMRGVSTQSVTTTHSPEIAAYFRPAEIVVLSNDKGALRSVSLQETPSPNALMRLYTLHRAEVCEALMHRVVIIPEGITEYRWFRGLLRATVTAEAFEELDESRLAMGAMGLLPTQDAQIVSTYEHFASMGPTFLPLVDGDTAGREYVKQLSKLTTPPARIARLPNGYDLEKLLGCILYPESDDEWKNLEARLQLAERTEECLLGVLRDNKRNWAVHDSIIELVGISSGVAARFTKFLSGVAAVAAGESSPSWVCEKSIGKSAVWVWSPPSRTATT